MELRDYLYKCNATLYHTPSNPPATWILKPIMANDVKGHFSDILPFVLPNPDVQFKFGTREDYFRVGDKDEEIGAIGMTENFYDFFDRMTNGLT